MPYKELIGEVQVQNDNGHQFPYTLLRHSSEQLIGIYRGMLFVARYDLLTNEFETLGGRAIKGRHLMQILEFILK